MSVDALSRLAALADELDGAHAMSGQTPAVPEGPKPTADVPASSAEPTRGPLEPINVDPWLAPHLADRAGCPRSGDVVAWQWADAVQCGVVLGVSKGAGLAYVLPLRSHLRSKPLAKPFAALVLVTPVEWSEANAAEAFEVKR